jgi:uncharacterized protein GlcG (DUF336 family)
VKALLVLAVAGAAYAQPTLGTQAVGGVLRAALVHSVTGLPVTDANPAMPQETLLTPLAAADGDVTVLIAAEPVPAHWDGVAALSFTVPADAAGSFVEIAIVTADGKSNAASFPVAASDPSQLLAADVDGLVMAAAAAVADPHMAVAVTDRLGRPLAIYRKPLASDDDVETALSLARTGAFFSNDQAPLSSRTVQTISREHFPNNIPNQPAAPLFGIENTNRGCDFNTTFLPGKSIPPAKNASGTGPGKGVTTVPGGIPVYKGGSLVVGGLGVAGVDADTGEFAAVAATAGTPFFVPLPLPTPGAVYINGVRLPYVNQTTRPAGTPPDPSPAGVYQIQPRDGNADVSGYLVGPLAGSALSAADVDGIIQSAIATANRTRAQIRLPLGTRARFVIAVADLDGTVLGLHRMSDATVFSIDVSVAKARNVVYFSSASIDPRDLPGVPLGTAVTNRTIGFGSQSMFPSGIDGTGAGPFRDPYLYDLANPCTQGRQPANPNQNGVVFFPGSAPLYRNGTMVGGLGVSGDGVDQDDYVTAAGSQGFDAPANIRADQVFIRGVRLPYLSFPRNPEQ